MKFLDLAFIHVAAGSGGKGCRSFRREAHVPFGGPDGGNGGRGGNVFLAADRNLQTLADFEYHRNYKAGCGKDGGGSGCNGRSGEDLTISVPCGTLIYDNATGQGLADLVEHGDMLLIAHGGRGGRGNRAFASSKRRVPNFAEKGSPGETLHIRVELKLIADFGFVGLPNVGKSSLLAALSYARPKVAAYPFTTLSPNLGVLTSENERLVLADIPGLIEGASENKGLGLAFLRHIQRCRLLIHVVDLSMTADEILKNYALIRQEMSAYDPDLLTRPCVVLGNKLDLICDDLNKIKEIFNGEGGKNYEFLSVSALSGEGIEELKSYLLGFSQTNPRPVGEARMFAQLPVEVAKTFRGSRAKAVQIIKEPDDSYRVIHHHLEEAADRYDFDYEENIARYGRLLRKYRIESLLEAAGAKVGDTVRIGSAKFDFTPDFYEEYDDEEEKIKEGE